MKIQINNLSDALNKFNSDFISKDLEEYITQEAFKDIKKTKVLNITGNLNITEQEILTNIIHKHFKTLAQNLNKIDKYDDYFRLLLLLLGIILISISQETSLFFSELFLITGWVFVWEMLYDAIFNQIKRKRKAYLYRKLAVTKINFIN